MYLFALIVGECTFCEIVNHISRQCQGCKGEHHSVHQEEFIITLLLCGLGGDMIRQLKHEPIGQRCHGTILRVKFSVFAVSGWIIHIIKIKGFPKLFGIPL